MVVSTLGVVLASWPTSAEAQQWLENRRFSEGPGVRLGRSLVLHPGLGIEAGYDSNVFYSYADSPYDAGRLRISAHLDLATRPPQRTEDENGDRQRGSVEFRLGVSAAYHEFLSSVDRVTAQRDVDVGALLNLHFLPGRTFSIILDDNYVRTLEPSYEGREEYAYTNDRNEAKLTFQYSPGGGLFELQFGYAFGFRFFETSGPSGNLQYLGNYTSHDAFVNIRWRFLPKTALIFAGSFRPIFHEDGSVEGARQVHDSYNVRGTIGVVGLLTRRFSLLAQVGYGAGFYVDGGPDYDMVIGRLDLRFHITPTAKIALGYNRDYFDAVFADYYSRDRVSLTYDHLIAGRVLLSLRAGFSYLSFSPVSTPSGAINRDDPMIDGTLFVEYRIRDWLAINATVRYIGNLTDSGSAYTATWGTYHQVLAMGGIRAMY